MVRAGVLGGGTLDPFGGGSVDFGSFNILDTGQVAQIAFSKVETAWRAGNATNAEYLAAFAKYAAAQRVDNGDRAQTEVRLAEARYTIERNVLVEDVNKGTHSIDDLLAFDRAKLEGLNPESGIYLDRLDRLRSTQAAWIGKQETEVVEKYSDGKMTTAQLQAWYRSALTDPKLGNNPDLSESLTKRIGELDDRLRDERDAKMLDDYSNGKVTSGDFLTYAIAAKARYAAGTEQAKDWTDRINSARDNAAETNLLYRYGLSQQYAQLEKFVKSNSANSDPRTSTSTSTRQILGADGQWHTVTTTSTKAVKPSAAELAAHAKLLVEIADAKKQMAQITAKIAGVGGWVSTGSALGFYSKQLTKYAKGSADWYRIQGKIDNLNDTAHSETVLGDQGIKITYPSAGGGGSSSGPSAASVSLATFMKAIARVESGGRYDARNASTGAFGKYQILPGNWSAWARSAGLPASAQPTPANQEKVAKAAMTRLWNKYHDWSRVAAAWHAGVAGTAQGPGQLNWGPKTSRYVDNVMSIVGVAPSPASRATSPTAISIMASVSGGHLSQSYNDHHDGIDIAAKEGSPIYAVADGVVSYASGAQEASHWALGGGNVVNIDIGGNKTAQFAHMSRYVVKAGQKVKAGQLIGYVGHTGNATGPHVHFGLWDHGSNTMVDPTDFLRLSGGERYLAKIPGGVRVATSSLGAHPANSVKQYQANKLTATQVAKAVKAAGYTPQTAYAAAVKGVAGGASVAPAGPTAPGKGPLLTVTGVDVLRRGGQPVVRTAPAGFPTGLDSAAFQKFYDHYEAAFNSGAETFVDTSTGRAIAYFIGSDPLGRIERMHQLDDLRGKLQLEKADAYAGTPAGIEAANAYNNAVKDAAAHDYQILDTSSSVKVTKEDYAKRGPGNLLSSAPPGQAVNPIALGIRILDRQAIAIKNNLRLASEAFARGDITAAYAHLQDAQDIAGVHLGADGEPIGSTANIGKFATAGQQALAIIERKYGGISLEEAVGKDKAGTIRADLDRLTSWDSELGELFNVGGEKSGTALLSQLKGLVKQTPDGQVIWDDLGDKGQLVLDPKFYRELKDDGTIEFKRAAISGVDDNGKPKRDVKGSVHVIVAAGSGTVDAYRAYTVGQVGSFIDAAGNRRPILGKIVDMLIGGKESMFFENPLTPGHWSSTPLAIKAPNLETVPTGTPGVYTYRWKGNDGTGNTYWLQADPTTGTYQILKTNPGAPLNGQSAITTPEPVGSGSDKDLSDLLAAAGFQRDTSGLGSDDLVFSDLESPVLGFTPKSYVDYRKNAQVPMAAADLPGKWKDDLVIPSPSPGPNLPTTYDNQGHYHVGEPAPAAYDGSLPLAHVGGGPSSLGQRAALPTSGPRLAQAEATQAAERAAQKGPLPVITGPGKLPQAHVGARSPLPAARPKPVSDLPKPVLPGHEAGPPRNTPAKPKPRRPPAKPKAVLKPLPKKPAPTPSYAPNRQL